MEKQNRLLLWACVVVPVVAAILAIIPPDQRLKGGIDLVGGASLTYEIDTTGLESSQIRGLAHKVIQILQRRVDPNAQLNLVWRPIGNTRLEIQMPRPPKAALERRQRYEEKVQKIEKMNVGRLELEQALAADDAQQRLSDQVRGVKERESKLTALQSAFQAYQTARQGKDEDAKEDTRAAYENALADVMKTSLDPGRLEDVLKLTDESERLKQIGVLRSNYPSYAEAIDEIEKAYKEWAERKAALEDPSDLKRLIRGAGVLEFRILAERDPENPTMLDADASAAPEPIQKYTDQLAQFGARYRPGDKFRWFPVDNVVDFMNASSMDQVEQRIEGGKHILEQYTGKWYVLMHADRQHGLLHDGQSKWRLKSAMASRDQNGRPCVDFGLDARGGNLFGRLTKENIGRQLTIVLDDVAMSQATIQSEIRQRGQITGNFSPEDVMSLVNTLEAGSLPGRLKEPPLMEKNVGPSLGKTNREMGLRAALIGFVAVLLVVLVYYRFAGFVADIALVLNMILTLGIMSLLEATFTLPGIAGLILSLGMAVDANVLINERFREERERGTAFKRALKAGYDKAFSPILDGNLTTLITCVVLGYLGSEEVKGFAMTLGFGIVISMFTALFVTRLIFLTLADRGLLKDLRMMRLIKTPNIDWMGMRRKVWPVSLFLVVGGIVLFVVASETDKESVYDIEFLGGTSVQIELAEGKTLSDEDVRQKITDQGEQETTSAVSWLRSAASTLAGANVQSGGLENQFLLTCKDLGLDQVSALLQANRPGDADALVEHLEPEGISHEGESFRVHTKPDAKITLDQFKRGVAYAADYARSAASLLGTAKVQTVYDIDDDPNQPADAFEIVTVESNKQLVQEAMIAALGDHLAIQRAIDFEIAKNPANDQGYFPIDEDATYLGEVIGREGVLTDVRGFKGGVAMVFANLDPPQRIKDITQRIREIRLQPGFEDYKWRKYEVYGLTEGAGDSYSEVALVVVDESLPYYDVARRSAWEEQVAQAELSQATEALRSEKALRKVVQFAPQIADQTRNQAVLATGVSLLAILVYIWLRFGNMQFGLAAIVSLVHNVAITLGFITLSNFFHGGPIGRILLIQDFKIDLAMIAALLTLIGYSLNDTIVVFDRIRENRGRSTTLDATMINNAINQTMSRTLLTSSTTLLVLVIMYFMAGPGVHGFCYALLLGIVVGTYSSVGVAAPLLYQPKVLAVVTYVLVALGLFGASLVATSNMVALAIIGLILAVALVALVIREIKSHRQYTLVAAPT